MKVFYHPQKLNEDGITLVVGSFDAIHIGHLQLFKKAKEQNYPVVVMMFSNPYDLPNKSREMFEELDVRLQKLANMNIDYAMIMKVDNHILTLLPEEFIATIKQNYNVKNIVCGNDFKFGRGASGQIEDLQQSFENVIIVENKKIANKKISSTIVMEQIPFGELDFANSMLVAPWTTNVQITKDNEFILPKIQIKPHSGFYAVTAIEDDNLYHAVVHVSRKGKYTIHMLNNDQNLQNKYFSIAWWKQLEITIKDENDKIKAQHMEVANNFFKNSL